MDSKTKHRILGVLVVTGVVIILLPFFQSGRELSSDAVAVKAPPFPDQAVQVTTTQPVNETIRQLPDDTIKTEHSADVTTNVPAITNPAVENNQAPIAEPAPVAPLPAAAEPEQKTKTADTIAPVAPDATVQQPVVSAPVATTTAEVEAETAAPLVNEQPVVKPKTKKASSLMRQASRKPKPAPYRHGPLDDNGLFKLQDAAWVIQIGDFKTKANALRVVNNLRANGYSAFIQRFSGSKGETRVFVGPENRQTVARELALKLESDMHLHGIVISYKPLAL